jgi:uncharacterized membrane protein YsdA (DUF1294 family)
MIEVVAHLILLLRLIVLQIAVWFCMLSLPLFPAAILSFGMNGITVTLLLFLYLVASITTINFYYMDKSAAKSDGQKRVPEKFLHLLELSGGWPGALYAQKKYRHKSAKKTYQAVFYLILIYHASLWISFFVFKGNLGWLCFFIFLLTLIAINMRFKPVS